MFYVSIACATCNEIPVSRLETLNITLFCNFHGYYGSTTSAADMVSPAPPSHQQPSHVLIDVGNTAQCAFALSFPAAGRLCQPYIYTCPDSCQNQNLTNLCLYGGLSYTYNTYFEEDYYRIYTVLFVTRDFTTTFPMGFIILMLIWACYHLIRFP